MPSPIEILEALVNPIGVVFALQLAGTIGFALKRKWAPTALCAVCAIILFTFGSTRLPDYLLASLERPYSAQQLEQIPKCDAVLMLGGISSRSFHDLLGFDAHEAFDRALTTVEIARLGKASTIILGGGGSQLNGWTESSILSSWITNWKVSDAALVQIPMSKNTRDEAIQVQQLMREKGWQKIIVVTSAAHLRRASAVFRQLAIPSVFVACDFNALNTLDAKGTFNPVPDASGFIRTQNYLHETAGWIAYSWRGWVGKPNANSRAN